MKGYEAERSYSHLSTNLVTLFVFLTVCCTSGGRVPCAFLFFILTHLHGFTI